MNHLFVKFKHKNPSQEDCTQIATKIQSLILKAGYVNSWYDDICYINENMISEDLQSVISLVFNIITIIVMIICFFSLVSSMGGNILS